MLCLYLASIAVQVAQHTLRMFAAEWVDWAAPEGQEN